MHILNSQGVQLYALDLPAPKSGAWNGGLGAPTIANIDADADMELVIGTVSSGVVAYDLPGTANARILWGTGRGSFKRTGISPIDDPFSLSRTPSARAIDAGNTTTYTLKVKANDNFNGAVNLNVTNPSPGVLTLNLTPSSLTPSGLATLTVTDLHAPGPLPGLFYNLPVIATGGGVTRTVTLSLLVGGNKTYLPTVLK